MSQSNAHVLLEEEQGATIQPEDVPQDLFRGKPWGKDPIDDSVGFQDKNLRLNIQESRQLGLLKAVRGKNKKGRVFVIGSKATEIGSSSTRASTSQANELHPLLQEEMDKWLEAANATLKKTVDKQKETEQRRNRGG
ncbi:uncharacterized protein G2W53_039604 [Senna tora]|uniref:Uncharacterized protein n=1 Tax=Senna tora TaxID=362788 RepID=A0A834SMY2_9FABA|nr:uncharacterized protein G2W53_039604 [Senna tora]